jgi:hypothetical protein
MTTSGTTTFTLTAAQVIAYALRKIGIVRGTQAVPADDAEDARIELEVMMKEWALTGPYITTKAEGSVTLVNATQSYDLTGTQPLRILHARYRNASGLDLPMEPLTRDEYYDLPNKASAGTPTQYFFDPQSATQTLFIWPVQATVTTETVKYTYQRRIQDIGVITNTIDVPQEWLSTVGYGLAARLLDEYGIADQVAERVHSRAGQLRQIAMDFDRDPVILMQPESRQGRR